MEPAPRIDDLAWLDHAPPGLMDRLWADGWRHFGQAFFRNSRMETEDGDFQTIQPLRIPVADFSPSKSQRRILGRNRDVAVSIVPAAVDEDREELFRRHAARFKSNVPDSLRDFIASPEPHRLPCECLAFEVRLGGRLVAVSYLDVDVESVSSVYAMFDPGESRRGLGIFTLLEEIRWAREQGKRWLYPGYATREPSFYDYKKSFRPLEWFDWQDGWSALE